MYVETGTFNLHNEEQVRLGGNYEIKQISNEENSDNCNILGQLPYSKGNVLIRTDTVDIEDLIKVFIRYTYDECEDIAAQFDSTIKSVIQMRWGTICPTKKILFVYKSKVFVAYGRYIYGYDNNYVVFVRGTDKINIEEEPDISPPDRIQNDPYATFNHSLRESTIECDKITLSIPRMDYTTNEYVYSFMIYDKDDETVDAFGLYR